MRQIYFVTATQGVISDAHPEGLLSTVPDFPKTYDSRNYPAADGNPNGDAEKAMIVARARFWDAVETLTLANNPNRVQWTVALERQDGQQLARKTWGELPDMTPPVPEEVDA